MSTPHYPPLLWQPVVQALTINVNDTKEILLRGNEPANETLRVINLLFATYSLRASMIVLGLICGVVIYHVLLLVIKDLWKAHREVAASLGLDQCNCSYYRERVVNCMCRLCIPSRNNQEIM